MCYKAAPNRVGEQALNADTAGAVSSLAWSLDLPLAGLALVLAAVLALRFAEIGRWRRYGRIGSLGVGATVGFAAALAVMPAWLTVGAADPLTTSAAFEAALLPPLALLSLDFGIGLTAAIVMLAAILGVTLGVAWPGALLLLSVLGIGVGLIRAKLEPLATWLDWRWARSKTPEDSPALGFHAPLDAAAHWRAAAIGVAPALLLLPLLLRATA